MKYTANYNLKKPEQEEYYNVDDFNENAEIIDEELTKIHAGIAKKKDLISSTNSINSGYARLIKLTLKKWTAEHYGTIVLHINSAAISYLCGDLELCFYSADDDYTCRLSQIKWLILDDDFQNSQAVQKAVFVVEKDLGDVCEYSVYVEGENYRFNYIEVISDTWKTNSKVSEYDTSNESLSELPENNVYYPELPDITNKVRDNTTRLDNVEEAVTDLENGVKDFLSKSEGGEVKGDVVFSGEVKAVADKIIAKNIEGYAGIGIKGSNVTVTGTTTDEEGNVIAGDVNISGNIGLGGGPVTVTNNLNTHKVIPTANDTYVIGQSGARYAEVNARAGIFDEVSGNAVDDTSGGTEGSKKIITSGAVYDAIEEAQNLINPVFYVKSADDWFTMFEEADQYSIDNNYIRVKVCIKNDIEVDYTTLGAGLQFKGHLEIYGEKSSSAPPTVTITGNTNIAWAFIAGNYTSSVYIKNLNFDISGFALGVFLGHDNCIENCFIKYTPFTLSTSNDVIRGSVRVKSCVFLCDEQDSSMNEIYIGDSRAGVVTGNYFTNNVYVSSAILINGNSFYSEDFAPSNKTYMFNNEFRN